MFSSIKIVFVWWIVAGLLTVVLYNLIKQIFLWRNFEKNQKSKIKNKEKIQ